MNAKLRADTLAQIAADIYMNGLPAPKAINLWDTAHSPHIEFRMDDDEPVAVDVWAKHLNLGDVVENEIGGKQGDPFVSRESTFESYGDEPAWDAPEAWRELGWQWVRVWSAIHPSSKAVQS